MSQIDILTLQPSQCPYFDVISDGSVNSVSVFPNSAVDRNNVFDNYYQLLTYSGGSPLSKFQERDNIQILSVGIYVPETFASADTTPGGTYPMANNAMTLVITNSAANHPVAYMPGICSAGGVIQVPFINYEMAFDAYCNIADLAKGTVYLPETPFTSQTTYDILANNYFYVSCFLTMNDISMIGVPAALNGTRIKVVPFIKIVHTLDLLP